MTIATVWWLSTFFWNLIEINWTHTLHWHLHEWSIGNFLLFEINSCVALTLTFESITFFGNGEQNCKFNIHVTFNPVLALLPLLGVLLAPDVSLEDGLVGAGHVAVLAEELLRLLVPHLLPVTLALRAHRIKIFQNVEKYFKIFHRAKKYMCSSAQNSP